MSNQLTKVMGIGMIFIPVALYFVPLDWLNGQHSICLFKNIFGIECWGCGITRATISVIQLDFSRAFHYNRLIVVVFPLLLYVWATTTYKLIKN
jgi:hypothetical protein